jgi:hypothetical protein
MLAQSFLTMHKECCCRHVDSKDDETCVGKRAAAHVVRGRIGLARLPTPSAATSMKRVAGNNMADNVLKSESYRVSRNMRLAQLPAWPMSEPPSRAAGQNAL